MNADASLDIRWCADVGAATDLARFFVANVTPEYISHSELQGQRALDVGIWRPNLLEIITEELTGRIAKWGSQVAPTGDSFPILQARRGDQIVGIALVSVFGGSPIPYAIQEDIAVDANLRSKGIDRAIIAWVTAEAEAAGCQRIFLESGLGNHRAHELFEHEGFATCSIVMMKKLRPAD